MPPPPTSTTPSASPGQPGPGGIRAGGSGMRAARPSRFSLTVPTVKHKEVLHNKVKFTTKVTPSEMGTHAQNASIFCAFSASDADDSRSLANCFSVVWPPLDVIIAAVVTCITCCVSKPFTIASMVDCDGS